jgi:HK97 family phage major capsid protein
MAVVVGSTGGFVAAPFVLDPTIVPTSAGSANPHRQICRVVQISGTNEWRSATSAGMTAASATEALEASDNSPTLAQVPLVTVRAQAFALVWIELSQDCGGIVAELGALIQNAKDHLEAVKFTTGTRTNEPYGLLVGATSITPTAGSGLLHWPMCSPLRTRSRALPS